MPTSGGGDLYVTWHGIHLLDHLSLENWYDRGWFEANRVRLPGTGTVYRVSITSKRSISPVINLRNMAGELSRTVYDTRDKAAIGGFLSVREHHKTEWGTKEFGFFVVLVMDKTKVTYRKEILSETLAENLPANVLAIRIGSNL